VRAAGAGAAGAGVGEAGACGTEDGGAAESAAPRSGTSDGAGVVVAGTGAVGSGAALPPEAGGRPEQAAASASAMAIPAQIAALESLSFPITHPSHFENGWSLHVRGIGETLVFPTWNPGRPTCSGHSLGKARRPFRLRAAGPDETRSAQANFFATSVNIS
jgi:hypothetical protein